MKQLYEVVKTYYVMAENEEEAEEVPTYGGDLSVEAHLARSVDEKWWESIPFGADDDKTCGQIIQSQKAKL